MSTTWSPALYSSFRPIASTSTWPHGPRPSRGYRVVASTCRAPDSPLPRFRTLSAVTTLAQFGVFGLAVMGQNLARNVASRGVPVAVYNRTHARTERMMAELEAGGHAGGVRAGRADLHPDRGAGGRRAVLHVHRAGRRRALREDGPQR